MTMNEMNITNAQYFNSSITGELDGISATIDGIEMYVPINSGNRHYVEIMRQVEAGTLTIEDAE